MTDQPAPLTDDELAHWKWSWEHARNGGLGCDDVLRLIATVEQAHRERDDAYTAIRWLRDGDEPIDVVAVSDAIHRARATTETSDG